MKYKAFNFRCERRDLSSFHMWRYVVFTSEDIIFARKVSIFSCDKPGFVFKLNCYTF